MPKVRPLTEALRREEARRRQRERTIRIINTASAAYGLDQLHLAAKAGIEYQAFCRRMRAESDFRLPELCSVAEALNMDAECRAALLGAREKCRFEPGYKPPKVTP